MWDELDESVSLGTGAISFKLIYVIFAILIDNSTPNKCKKCFHLFLEKQ